MTESRRDTDQARSVDLAGLLANLPPQKVDKKDLSEQLKDLPLELRLLSLADVSIERETEGLAEVIRAVKTKKKHV